jgi:hypothetical protein
VRRIGKLTEPGHTNLFQCTACGSLAFRDDHPPGKQT